MFERDLRGDVRTASLTYGLQFLPVGRVNHECLSSWGGVLFPEGKAGNAERHWRLELRQNALRAQLRRDLLGLSKGEGHKLNKFCADTRFDFFDRFDTKPSRFSVL